jgi:4-amino-4-deoxy-L-arabinose transferase-like glycosyltransferase
MIGSEQIPPTAATTAPGRTNGGADGRAAGRLPRGRELLILAVLYLLAFAPRAAMVAREGQTPPKPGSDQLSFYDEAREIAEGRGMVRHFQPTDRIVHTTYHMPGAGLWYALGVALLGPGVMAVRMAAVVASSASAPLTYALARTMMPRGWAAVAGVVCAVYPTWIFYSADMLTEPLYVPLVLFAALVTTRALGRLTFGTALAAGLAWGVAGLVRPHAFPIAALLTLSFAWASRSWKPPAAVVLAVVVTLTPWWIRNVLVVGDFVLLSTEAGETLLGANNPYVLADPAKHGLWIPPISIPEYREAMFRTRSEVELSATFQRMGKAYLLANPGAIPRLAFYKWRRWLTPITASGGATRLMVLASYGPLLALVLAGFASGRLRYSHALVPALALTLADAVIVAVYWGNLTRGRVALEVIWIPWGVLAFRLLIADPLARRLRGAPASRPTDAVA